MPKDITSPPITRKLSCPGSATFQQLHEALQIAFGWASTHTYDFKIKDPNAKPEALPLSEHIVRAGRMTSTGWKFNGARQNLLRVTEGVTISIDRLHNMRRGHAQTPEVSPAKTMLSKVFDKMEKRKEYEGAGIEYEYDFGDGWIHEIEIVGKETATDTFVCIEGEGHSAAEDVGSATGRKELLRAYRMPSPSKDQREQMEWFEYMCSNRDPRGLGNERDRVWGRVGVNVCLARELRI
jgi:hypothetical protein